MANPNIVNVAAIYGNTSTISLTTTNATELVSNAASILNSAEHNPRNTLRTCTQASYVLLNDFFVLSCKDF